MVRCMRVDSELKPFLWGGLMMSASYICNRTPHSALKMETPYKKLYEKDANLYHPRSSAQGPSYTSKSKQARPHVVGRDGVRLQRDLEKLLPHLEPKNTSRGGEQERRFCQNTTKSASRGQAVLAATRSPINVVRFQRRLAQRQLRLARRHGTGRAELYLCSGFRRRHACRNGRIASASTSPTRCNFA